MFVTFAPLWLVLIWGFRGDTGAVVAAFDSPLLANSVIADRNATPHRAWRNSLITFEKLLFHRGPDRRLLGPLSKG